MSPDLSGAERRIFAAAAEAIIGEPVGDDVVDAALPFIRGLPAADRALLGLLLRMLEYGAPLRTGRRLTRQSRDRRERYLRGWERSRLALRRQGLASLKALAALAYYGRDAAWGEVGYDGPWLGRVDVAVLAAPDLAAGVVRGRELRSDLRLRAQACVIGTGAGGAAALARLAERGIDVVAVEAGGHFTAADFTQRELDMLPRLFQGAGLRATSDKAIAILQGAGLGGSTLHNTGLVCPTPPGIAGRWRSEHGFPLEGMVLDRYLAEAMDALHAVPIPPERVNPSNEALRRGAQALGWQHRIALHNRSECCGCGYCMLGCAYNRKHNAALTFLPRAVAAGARILADARALRIEGRAGARRVVCELMDGNGQPTGRRATIEAPLVLVAAGALDTPALLRRSGLGNGRVGHGLRLHPSAVVAAVFTRNVEAWRGLPQAVLVEEFAQFLERSDGRGGFLIIAAAAWPGMTAALVPGIGAPHRALMREYPRFASAAVLVHDETAGRVDVARDGRPIARYWPGREDREELRRGVHALARLYLAAGAQRVHLPYADAPPVRTEAELDSALAQARAAPHRLSLSSVHPQGTCPLGARRHKSAVDPHGALWGERGIFVCDTSVFPTSVGVPPQVTTMAVAAATADYSVDERQ